MSFNNFEKLIPYFHDVGTIILQGWGEPLLHNDLCAMIRAAKGGTESSRGSHRHAKAPSPSVGFVTSGKGLDDHYSAELIDAGIDFIGFSFAGSTLTGVMQIAVGGCLAVLAVSGVLPLITALAFRPGGVKAMARRG